MFLAAATGAVAMQLILAGAAFGQTWSNNTFDISWGTASNWTPATVPNSPGATAIFNAVNNTAFGVVLSGGPFTVGTLNLDNDVPGGFLFQLGTLQLADMDFGVQPSVAAHRSGLILEFHKTENSLSSAQVVAVHQVPGEALLHYRRGTLSGGGIQFGDSKRYDNYAERPAIALLDSGLVQS